MGRQPRGRHGSYLTAAQREHCIIWNGTRRTPARRECEESVKREHKHCLGKRSRLRRLLGLRVPTVGPQRKRKDAPGGAAKRGASRAPAHSGTAGEQPGGWGTGRQWQQTTQEGEAVMQTDASGETQWEAWGAGRGEEDLRQQQKVRTAQRETRKGGPGRQSP